MPLLKPPEPLEADRFQTALTRRFLTPVLADLNATFLAMRAETDQILASNAEARRGKPYPYGYCFEIAMDVLTGLRARCARSASPGARALAAFLRNGGEARLVWGVLRDRYFQNAIQLGSLYVDVANDSVDVRKPKVEIMAMSESGLELVRDVPHFADVAARYWDLRVYANNALPSLAPLFPMIVIDPDGRAALQSRAGFMVRLFGTDGFHLSEQWLREGPPPPPEVVRRFREACPEDLLRADPVWGVEAAIEACRTLRDSGTVIDEAWAERMGAAFDRVPPIRIPGAALGRAALTDRTRTNALPSMGVLEGAA